MRYLWVAVLLAGCAAAPPVTRIVTVRQHVPPALLSCAVDPPVPAGRMQSDAANYIVELWAAGGDCRAHLGAVAKALGE